MGGKIKVAILGSGNIGTDLMIRSKSFPNFLRWAFLVGIDAASDADLGRHRDYIRCHLGRGTRPAQRVAAKAGKTMID